MRIAITGHRPSKLGNDYYLKSPLVAAVKNEIVCKLIELDNMNDKFTLITGMALGVDTLFAQIAIEQEIPFIAAIPFYGQDRMWPPESQAVYKDILSKASEIVDVSTTLPLGMTVSVPIYMQRRNEWMVDNCDVLIAVWDKSSGGTANCVKYALEKGFKMGQTIIHINPKSLKINHL